jgi:hypothetical protein
VSSTDKSRAAAADALMEALEEWASSLGDAGVRKSNDARYFPSRQMDRTMRTAHRDGVLFERLTEWLPNYRFRGDAYTERMKDIVRHGAMLWESVVAAEDRSWSPYIEPEHRQMLLKVVGDIYADIARGDQLVEQMRRDPANRRPG